MIRDPGDLVIGIGAWEETNYGKFKEPQGRASTHTLSCTLIGPACTGMKGVPSLTVGAIFGTFIY
jgi:hypothetical protein